MGNAIKANLRVIKNTDKEGNIIKASFWVLLFLKVPIKIFGDGSKTDLSRNEDLLMMVARPNMVKIVNPRNSPKIKKNKFHAESVKIQTESLKYFSEKLTDMAKFLLLK